MISFLNRGQTQGDALKMEHSWWDGLRKGEDGERGQGGVQGEEQRLKHESREKRKITLLNQALISATQNNICSVIASSSIWIYVGTEITIQFNDGI